YPTRWRDRVGRSRVIGVDDGVSDGLGGARGRGQRVGLAVVSLGAAAIHFAVVGDHLREYVLFGVFFVVVGWLQAMWAVAIVAVESRRLLAAGLVGNLLVVGVWTVSRTVGNPLGPAAGRPEAALAVDSAATVLEVVIVAGAAIALWVGSRPPPVAVPGIL